MFSEMRMKCTVTRKVGVGHIEITAGGTNSPVGFLETIAEEDDAAK